jgi:hypothetical protein
MLPPAAHLPALVPPLATEPLILFPLQINGSWLFLLLPLVLAIAVVYKTIKLDDLRQMPLAALRLTAQIVAFMTLAAAALWLLVELV